MRDRTGIEALVDPVVAAPRPGAAVQRSSVVELLAGVAGLGRDDRRSGHLIVDDGQVARDGQMNKSEFMARVREAACESADAELSRAGHSTDGCPYVERWLSYYEGRSAAQLERAVRRYAPAGGATRATDYLPAIRDRVGHAAAQWVLQGTIPDDLMADAASSYGGADGDDTTTNAVGAAPTGTAVARKASGPAVAAGLTATQLASQLGPGRPLDGTVRGRMEGALGHSLARVRIHDDARAASVASDVGARAFTFGDHVALGRDQPAAGTIEGDALLAHELAHVAQQDGAPTPAGALRVDDDAGLERDADAAAAEVVHDLHGGSRPDRSAPRTLRGGLRLQRCKTEQQRLQEQAATLVTELQHLIAGADWRTGIRPRRYPAESAAGLERARQRHLGTEPDLTGLGAVVRLEHFAAAIRTLQGTWAGLDRDARVTQVAALADAELQAVGVPGFEIIDHEPMEWKAYFQQGLWRFVISDDLVGNDTLDDDAAAELANTALHESRHAEQAFLAARYRAGQDHSLTASQLAADVHIPETVAAEAIRTRFDGGTPREVADLGARMYDAHVVHAVENQRISDDDYVAEMATARREAEVSLAALQASVTARTVADAVVKRDTLRAAILEVERRYTLYRNIPYEFDAHEVGDAAGLAFRGWR